MKFIRQLLSLFSVILAGSVAMVALRTVYQAALPERPPYTEGQQRLVAGLADDVQHWLADTLPAGQTRAVFANLGHDDFAFVSGPVRAAIWRSGRFDLAPRGFEERLRQRIGWTVPHWTPGPAAADHARARHAAVVIDGNVEELTDSPSPMLRAHLEIVRPATGEVVAARDFAIQPHAPLGALNRRLARAVPPNLRILAWIAIVLLLPLAVYPFARELLVDGSNGMILLVLLLLVAVDVAAAYLLYAGHVQGWMGGVATLAIFGLSFGLNAQYLSWIKTHQA